MLQNSQQNQSEVARLRNLMDSEREAMRLVMNGYAITSQHEFITTRMENMETYHGQLKGLVGETKAAEILVQAMQGPKARP